MSSLIGNLLSNSNALNVHSLGVQTAGNNIANVNDPAYARQRVNMRDSGNYLVGTSVQQRGIEALGIEHIRNSVLDNQILREAMRTASYGAEADLLSQLEASVNDIIDRQDLVDSLNGNKSENLDSGGIATALDDFLNTFAELASTPSSEPIREVLFERAFTLLDQFNIADQRLVQLDEYIGDRIYDEVAEVNELLNDFAALNKKIAQFEAQKGIMAPDLRDQRVETLEKLAQFIEFDVEPSGINPSMLDLKVRNDTGTGKDNFTKLVTGASVNGELAFDEFVLGANGQPVANANGTFTPQNKLVFLEIGTQKEVGLNIKGGSLAGAVDVKHNKLVALKSDFDTLASSVVSSVNKAYQGDPAVATNLIFDSTGITAATIKLDNSLVSTTTLASGEVQSFYDISKLKTSNDVNGGNELAVAIGELVSQKTIGVQAGNQNSGMTFSKFISQFSARVGSEVQSAQGMVESQETVTQFLTSQRESYSGVSIDEEMTDLLRFQRAFQGTSRVISTLDQMLQQVVAGLIR